MFSLDRIYTYVPVYIYTFLNPVFCIFSMLDIVGWEFEYAWTMPLEEYKILLFP
jgi:hypothetical protein